MAGITQPDNHTHRALEPRLKERPRSQKIARVDQFFTFSRRDTMSDFDAPTSPERTVRIKTTQTLVLRAGTRQVRINLDAEVMTAVFPAWPVIAGQGRSGTCKIKNVSFDEPEAEFAIKLLVRIAHGEHQLQKSLETATAKQLFYVGEVWMWFGEPKVLHNTNAPFLPTNMIVKGVENLISKAEGLHKVQDWLLLGMVGERFYLESVIQAVCETIILSYRADGQMVVDKTLESMTPSQFIAIRELYPNPAAFSAYRLTQIEAIFDGIRSLVDQHEQFENGILPSPAKSEGGVSRFQMCPACEYPEIDDLLEGLMAEGLWPLCVKSYQ
ncbi:hypothetical protein B0T10DRAFT_268982 [Thelonectria olida]|uniref:Uncharacterized protein n=1 Tax=Thelonectria olida TaxID=1576542 RepID=A0A9P8W7T0_9HYPO|nr:hypothetical protein B0T10DRAFT_268982 [Thelonectria olida]